MKRRRDEAAEMEIVWQTPANPPERHDYIFRNGNKKKKKIRNSFQIIAIISQSSALLQGNATSDLTTSSSSLMYSSISL